MRRRLAALCSVLLVLASLSACAGAPAETPTPTPTPASTETPAGVMSRFTTTDLEGNEVTADLFADYDLTMVNIWATFCSPCIREMPDLGEIHAEYADKGIQVVGLVADVLNQDGSVSDSQVELAQEIVERTQANYRHLLPSQDLFTLLNQATNIPTTFFVDKTGAQVGYTYVGSKSKADWLAAIDATLAEVQE